MSGFSSFPVLDLKMVFKCVVVHRQQAFDSKAHRGKSEAVGEKPILVTAHYKQAEVEGKLYKLGDCVHIHVSFFLLPSCLYNLNCRYG